MVPVSGSLLIISVSRRAGEVHRRTCDTLPTPLPMASAEANRSPPTCVDRQTRLRLLVGPRRVGRFGPGVPSGRTVVPSAAPGSLKVKAPRCRPSCIMCIFQGVCPSVPMIRSRYIGNSLSEGFRGEEGRPLAYTGDWDSLLPPLHNVGVKKIFLRRR